jgi:hypothetical protein
MMADSHRITTCARQQNRTADRHLERRAKSANYVLDWLRPSGDGRAEARVVRAKPTSQPAYKARKEDCHPADDGSLERAPEKGHPLHIGSGTKHELLRDRDNPVMIETGIGKAGPAKSRKSLGRICQRQGACRLRANSAARCNGHALVTFDRLRIPATGSTEANVGRQHKPPTVEKMTMPSAVRNIGSLALSERVERVGDIAAVLALEAAAPIAVRCRQRSCVF